MEIRDAFMKQSEFETDVFSNGFTFPLSSEFVKENFATDAYQMKSGNSVVILCPSERSVYKSALTRGEAKRLQCLLRNFQYDLQYSSLPIDIKFIGSEVYYKYIALNMQLYDVLYAVSYRIFVWGGVGLRVYFATPIFWNLHYFDAHLCIRVYTSY